MSECYKFINFINLNHKPYKHLTTITVMPRNNQGEYTTISITKRTRDVLREIAKKSETYDDLIKRLLIEAGYTDVLIKNKMVEVDNALKGWLNAQK